MKTKIEKVSVGNVTVKIYGRKLKTASGKLAPYFYLADYTNGKRRMRGFNDAGAARREAERIASQLATGQSTASSMRNSEAASYGRSIEILRPTGASLEMASSTFAKCFEILGGDFHVDAARF